MNIYTCPEHGAFLVRAKFRKNTEDNTWSANKLVYEAAATPTARTARRQSSNNI